MIRRCLRLQLRSQLPASLAVLLVFGLGSFLGVALTGRAEGLFYIYYQMYPAMGLFVLFIYGSTNTANLANVVLSLGVTRREFCIATQWLGLIMALLAAALGVPVALLPGWTGLTWIQPPLSLGALPTLAAASLFCQEAAWVMGFLAGRRRWLMGLMVLLGSLLLGVAAFFLTMAAYAGDAVWSGGGLWVPVGLLAGAAVLAGLFWLALSKYAVR